MTSSRTYNFNVNGMHCNACVLMVESELKDVPQVLDVHARLASHTVSVMGDFGDLSPEEIARTLSVPLVSHGYTLSVEKQVVEKKWSEFKIAIPVAIGFIFLFIFLQKIGIVNVIGGNDVTYGTAFVIGIIASLSSCMAVVGGLVLSMSATFAKEGDKVKPQIMFHVGRIVSFFFLGGIIGTIGKAFTLGSIGIFVLSVIVACVMIILGINLLDVFPWAKKFQLSVPKSIGRYAHGVSKISHTLTPLLVGIATFFLPCGFTQSMQLFALTTGSFAKGGFTMLSFALGTLPVLALVSFSSFSITNAKKSGIFFKSAGLIVIMFALLNLINACVAIGLIPPFFTF